MYDVINCNDCNLEFSIVRNLLKDLKDIQKGYDASKFTIDKECTEDVSLSLADYEQMAIDLAEVRRIYRSCKVKKMRCQELQEIIDNNNKQLQEYKICPLCGHELNGEHIEC